MHEVMMWIAQRKWGRVLMGGHYVLLSGMFTLDHQNRWYPATMVTDKLGYGRVFRIEEDKGERTVIAESDKSVLAVEWHT